MIKHFITTSIRYLLRNKWITIINIVGLTFGITFSILIGLFVKNEISVDKSFADKNRVYRLEIQLPNEGKNAITCSAHGPDLKEGIPGIADVLRIQFWQNFILRDSVQYHTIPNVVIADSTFFNLFDQTWVYGKPEGALNKPYSLVITDETSQKLFGKENPVGCTYFNQSRKQVYTITGVIKKRNDTHLKYDALLSLVTRSDWDSTILHTYRTFQWLTYFKLEKNINPRELEEMIHAKTIELIPYLDDDSRRDFKVILNPLNDIYFTRDTYDINVLHGNLSLVKIFIAIALLIIVIACINFINLSTARALKRAKEVGIRKVVGSKKSTLIKQFLCESFVVSIISTLLGTSIAELFIPFFNNLIEKQTELTYFDNPYTIPTLLAIVVLTGFLAGLYPAYVISSFKPLRVIKGEIYSGKKSLGFRRALIAFQFLITVILINGSILIWKQLQFTQEKDLGFQKERILTVRASNGITAKRTIVKEKLLRDPSITNVSFSYTKPGAGLNNEGFSINDRDIVSNVFSVDPDYLETMGIELLAGRNFDENIGSDSINCCVVNETMAKEIGLDNPLNQFFHHDSWYITMFPVTDFKIIGVVKDFHFKSFRTSIEPLIFAWNPKWYHYINIKIASGKIAHAMNHIKSVMNEFDPGAPITYDFIDDSFDRMYKSDDKMGKLLIYFSILAITIAILGLVGMAAYMAEQRTKEIAIKKTLGASSNSIIASLSRDFTFLVFFANLAGWPIVVWLGSKWLSEFVYRTSLSPAIFILGGIISLTIAIATVVMVTLKSANKNPALSLRHE